MESEIRKPETETTEPEITETRAAPKKGRLHRVFVIWTGLVVILVFVMLWLLAKEAMLHRSWQMEDEKMYTTSSSTTVGSDPNVVNLPST